MIPKDPVMLLSFLNLKLRDYDFCLETLCEELELSLEEVCRKMDSIGYHYDKENNQFV